MPNWRVSWDEALAFSICESASDELVDERWAHTDSYEFYSGPICKYMQVDIGGCSSMCEGAFKTVWEHQHTQH